MFRIAQPSASVDRFFEILRSSRALQRCTCIYIMGLMGQANSSLGTFRTDTSTAGTGDVQVVYGFLGCLPIEPIPHPTRAPIENAG